jgi:hypothetical protein
MQAPFVFDSNSWRVLENYYPSQFPSFWDRFNGAVDDGSVVSVREVFNELDRQLQTDWMRTWVRAHRGAFLDPAGAETVFVSRIFLVPHFQVLVGQEQLLRGQPVADPFVIACAQHHRGCVVTEETLRPNAAKIPNVCQHFGVEYTNVEGFLAHHGWQF